MRALEVIQRRPGEPCVCIQNAGQTPAADRFFPPVVSAPEDRRGPHTEEFECVLNVVVGGRESSAQILMKRTG